MKKILSIVFILLFVFTLASCNEKGNNNSGLVGPTNEIKIILPNGTPYVALGGLLGTDNISIEAVQGPANLKTALVSGSHDIVIAPVNIGASQYVGGFSKYKLAAVVTMNNAYIVTKEENNLTGLSDLVGQKVAAFGQAGIPGSLLTKLYNDNENLDINNVSFTLQSSSAVYSAFVGGSLEEKYVLMSEPEISRMIIENNFKVKKLDLCSLLGIDVAQACVFVNPESANQDDISKVLGLIKENIQNLNENPTAYVEKIITLDRNFGGTGKEVLINSIPTSNIVYKETSEAKTIVEAILTILNIGAPNEEFYYKN